MITLYKGDDTNGQLGKKCVVRFHCDDAVDMNGVTVKFNLLNVVTKEFENVHDGDELEVFVSHIDSRKLPLGIVYGKLWGEDASGKIRTFANRIPFCVTMDLRKVYGSDGLDSVDVHVYSSVDWDSIANKPTLFPSNVSMVEGLEEALAQAGKVNTVNGQSPDENGNIEIEIPSCKVTSVNGKDGDVELTAQDIPYGGEGASNVETAIEQNAQAIGDNADAIDSLEQQVGEIQTNTYTKSEVDDKINQSAAHYLTKRAGTEGNYTYPQFATHADLEAAKAAHTEANPQFFYGDEAHTPDKNDYCIVLADETHDGATTRYMFVGSWDDNGYFRYQYTINPTAFTDEQWAAINSLTSVDEDGNLCFDGIPFINSSGELLFTEEDPIFTAWKNEVQIVLGSGANIASGKYKQIAIGAHATANGQNAIALGSSEPGGKTNGPRAMAQNSVAIGAGANATATNSVQIFAGTNNKSGTIQLGNKVVAFLSDIPISQADIDDYRYYKGHWSMGTTYKTGDIVRAERTVEGQEEKEVVYFKSLRDNNLAQNPFNEGSTYWTRTTDDEGLEKLTLFVKAAIAGMTGADIPVSPSNDKKLDVAIAEKIGQGENAITRDILIKSLSDGIKVYRGENYTFSDTSAGILANGIVFVYRNSDTRYVELNPNGIVVDVSNSEYNIALPERSGTMALKAILTLNGQRVFNGSMEITTYADLLALVKEGECALLDTVAGTIAKEALFHPHMADETAIRFDATGTLGGKVYTRSFAFTPKSGGGIAISRGDLTEVAKKSDVPAVVAPASDMALKNKAADAYETGKALEGKFDKNENFGFQHYELGDIKYDLLYLGSAINPEDGLVSITKEKQGENGAVFAFRVNDGKGNMTIVTLENTGNNDEKFALVSQLSGITAQDITDFLKYKGEITLGYFDPELPTCWRTDKGLNEGCIALLTGSYYKAKEDIVPHVAPEYFAGKCDRYTPTEGFKKLLDLYEKYKATLFTDMAFIEAVKKYGGTQIKEDEHGEFYYEVEV